MGNLGLQELLVIFIAALLLIGPKRLPELARALAQAVRAFQDALNTPHDADHERPSRADRTPPSSHDPV